MACRDCELRCGNKGITEDEAYKVPIPDWCPDPVVRYPDIKYRTGGGGVGNYGQMGELK